MSTHTRRVVITGLGTINSIGLTVSEFWDNLSQGKNGVRTSKNMNLDDHPVKIAGEVDIPDIRDYFSKRKMARRLDRHILFGHVAGVQAVRDAGLQDYAHPERVGVLIGTGAGGVITHYQQISRMADHGVSSVSPFYVSSSIPNTGSAMLSMEFGFTGPSFSVNSACASSNHAFGIAYNMIVTNMADVIITGGAEAAAVENSVAAFSQIGALSTRNDDPATASRPFDLDRDGFVLGEGAGMLCLEELEQAKKRGAHIYAEIVGFSFTADAHDLVAPHPEGVGAAQAICNSLKMAKLNAEDLGFINCHGTSTQLGDKAECMAINRALGSKVASSIPAHSTKSMIGHLIGAAGAVEAIAGLMALEKGIIHPTINQFTRDPDINYNIVTQAMEKRVDSFISNAFGFGGQNACILFSKFS